VKDHLRAASVRLYGEPPPKDAARSHRLRWVRRLYLRTLLFALPAYACIFVFARESWVFVAVAVGALIWLEAVASLSIRIRSEQRHERMT
jgi:hypothetical protein